MKDLTSMTTILKRGEEEIEVNIEGYILYSVDCCYGADADGNRGVKTVEVDDVEDLYIWDTFKNEQIEPTEIEKERFEQELIQQFLNG